MLPESGAHAMASIIADIIARLERVEKRLGIYVNAGPVTVHGENPEDVEVLS